MTLTARNYLIRGGIATSSIFSIVAVAAFIHLYKHARIDTYENLFRVIELPDNMPFGANLCAAICAVLALTIICALTLWRVYFLFEKTPSIEITFFSVGLIAVSAECIRILAPFFYVWESQPEMMVLISRAVLFIRVFFVLSALSAAIFSIEKTLQRAGSLIFFITALSFFIAERIPVNYSLASSAFFLIPGYFSILLAIAALLILIAFFSFLIQAKPQTSVGFIFLSAGWAMLAACDNWVLFAAGTVFFATGAAVYVHSLHKHYLWQ